MSPEAVASIRLVSVSFLNRKSPAAAAATPPTPAETEAAHQVSLGKGAPTPKQNAKVQRRGPVAPPPMTQREAIKRAKTSGGKPLTKDERRAQAAQRRERMMKGDDGFLLARDKGPVRAYVRDLTDARRNLAGVLLPVAILSFIVLIIPNPTVQAYAPLILMIVLLGALADTIVFSRQLSRRVAERFPKGDPAGLSLRGRSLGFYAFNRAMLPRKWRAPRPRYKTGDIVE